MNAISLSPGRAVYILWEDSAAIDGWRKGLKPDTGKITSVGFVVDADNNGVMITTSLNDQFSAICPLSIPWGAVAVLHELEPQWGKEYEPHVCATLPHRILQNIDIKGVTSLPSSYNPDLTASVIINDEDRKLTEEYEKICQEIQAAS